jgi:hypothetical protein
VIKTFISAKDLELIALREIRSFPGGEYVAYVEVECQGARSREADWTLQVIVRDGADLGRVQQAVKTTAGRLKHRYSLRTDW